MKKVIAYLDLWLMRCGIIVSTVMYFFFYDIIRALGAFIVTYVAAVILVEIFLPKGKCYDREPRPYQILFLFPTVIPLPILPFIAAGFWTGLAYHSNPASTLQWFCISFAFAFTSLFRTISWQKNINMLDDEYSENDV